MLEMIEVEKLKSQEEIINLAEENNFSTVEFKTIKFQNKEEALDYINDICFEDKTVFVKYLKVIESCEDNKGLCELKTKLEEEENSLKMFPYSIVNKLKEQTSNTKGCKTCNSYISRDYLIKNLEDLEIIEIKDLVCPICKNKDYMMNSSEEKRLFNIKKRITSLKDKIEKKEERQYLKAKKEEVGILAFNRVPDEEL